MATTAGTDHVVRDVAGEDGLAVSLGVDWDLDPLEVVGQEESYVLVRVGQVCGLSTVPSPAPLVRPQPVELQIVSGGISASAVLKNSTGCTLGSLKSKGSLTVTRQMS